MSEKWWTDVNFSTSDCGQVSHLVNQSATDIRIVLTNGMLCEREVCLL